ncbi:hypothetical protein PMAYCL1PPCAC_22551, partial [Pristionchus mayeri]
VAMEHGEVTPEFIESMVPKSIAFHKETVELAAEYFRDQITRLTNFHRRMCDRFIDNQVPMLNTQLNAVQSVHESFVNAWIVIIRVSVDIHSAELEYLRSQCIRPLSPEECPLSKFTAVVSHESTPWIRRLGDIYEKLKAAYERAENYRVTKRLELQGRLNEHTEKRDEWLRKLCKNYDDPVTVAQIEQAILLKEIENEGNPEQSVECLAEAKKYFMNFLEKRCTELIQHVELSVETCKQSIDDCISNKLLGSSDSIREMMNNEMSRIKNFQQNAMAVLERLSSKLDRSMSQQRAFLFEISCYYLFSDEMKIILKEQIEALKSGLEDKRSYLSAYRKSDREEIRKTHDTEIKANEKFLLHEKNPFSKMPDIDLSEFSDTKKVISSGGEGAVFRFDISGKLLIGFDEHQVPVAAKKFWRVKRSTR